MSPIPCVCLLSLLVYVSPPDALGDGCGSTTTVFMFPDDVILGTCFTDPWAETDPPYTFVVVSFFDMFVIPVMLFSLL